MNQPYGYIYLIYDHFHNKVYVGQSKRLKYINSYLGSGKIIQNIANARPQHLEKRILGYCNTKEELNKAEKICIEFYNARNRIYGYNISLGGEVWGEYGHAQTLNTRQKISSTLKAKGCSPWCKGKKLSQEIKLKMSIARKGKKRSLEACRHISEGQKGKTLSEETKRKIGKANTGRKQTPEEKLSRSLANKGKQNRLGTQNKNKRRDFGKSRLKPYIKKNVN